MLFRDYPRAPTEEARRSGELKREVAARFLDDREAYTNAKTDSVREFEARAKARLPGGP